MLTILAVALGAGAYVAMLDMGRLFAFSFAVLTTTTVIIIGV